jgi:GNAT superfamily N-acetyltransferase
MTHTPQIRTFAPHEWKTYKDLRLRALKDAPNAFGRTLAETVGWPDAKWAGRLSEGAGSPLNLPLVVEVDKEPAGLAWGRIEEANPQVAHLYQMWVAPEFRRLGAAQMLVEAVIAWARAQNVCYLELGVTMGNIPATRLYSRVGFEPAGDPHPLREGSVVLEQPMRLKLMDCAP